MSFSLSSHVWIPYNLHRSWSAPSPAINSMTPSPMTLQQWNDYPIPSSRTVQSSYCLINTVIVWHESERAGNDYSILVIGNFLFSNKESALSTGLFCRYKLPTDLSYNSKSRFQVQPVIWKESVPSACYLLAALVDGMQLTFVTSYTGEVILLRFKDRKEF